MNFSRYIYSIYAELMLVVNNSVMNSSESIYSIYTELVLIVSSSNSLYIYLVDTKLTISNRNED
jgi:hypothetical protein